MFYTYAYLRDNGTPYYIGKGKGNRFKGNHKHTPVPKNKSKILILKNNLTEEESLKHEIYMIAIFGRKDKKTGILINLTDGGEGLSGYIHTEESRLKMKNAIRPPIKEETKKKLSQSQKQKLSENPRPYSFYEKNIEKMNQRNKGNREKHKKHGEFMRGKNYAGKKINYNGVEYDSIESAARKNNTNRYFILKNLNLINKIKNEKYKNNFKIITNCQKWKCTITGHISTPGPLSIYQRARNIDTINRIKII